jgi:hypothetical protein
VGADFDEIFSPVAILISNRVLISMATTFDLEIDKLDVKKMFLHGDVEEEIYMKWVEEFVVKGKKETICKLKRSLYGLKESLRMWYQNFDTCILRLGSVRRKYDYYVYSKK